MVCVLCPGRLTLAQPALSLSLFLYMGVHQTRHPAAVATATLILTPVAISLCLVPTHTIKAL